jgi:hypothetical protein
MPKLIPSKGGQPILKIYRLRKNRKDLINARYLKKLVLAAAEIGTSHVKPCSQNTVWKWIK